MILKITPVEFADQVLKVALTKELKRIEWAEVDISKKGQVKVECKLLENLEM
jgi:hypothetical protein